MVVLLFPSWKFRQIRRSFKPCLPCRIVSLSEFLTAYFFEDLIGEVVIARLLELQHGQEDLPSVSCNRGVQFWSLREAVQDCSCFVAIGRCRKVQRLDNRGQWNADLWMPRSELRDDTQRIVSDPQRRVSERWQEVG